MLRNKSTERSFVRHRSVVHAGSAADRAARRRRTKLAPGSNVRQTPVKDLSNSSAVTVRVPVAGSSNLARPARSKPSSTTKWLKFQNNIQGSLTLRKVSGSWRKPRWKSDRRLRLLRRSSWLSNRCAKRCIVPAAHRGEPRRHNAPATLRGRRRHIRPPLAAEPAVCGGTLWTAL